MIAFVKLRRTPVGSARSCATTSNFQDKGLICQYILPRVRSLRTFAVSGRRLQLAQVNQPDETIPTCLRHVRYLIPPLDRQYRRFPGFLSGIPPGRMDGCRSLQLNTLAVVPESCIDGPARFAVKSVEPPRPRCSELAEGGSLRHP